MRARDRALLDWYAQERRKLPWRDTKEPWPILVSEVMLQQTQATRVAPIFERFLARFPTPSSLASAPPGEALARWSGLGYNRRALRLRDAAMLIVSDGWPVDEEGLRHLPGVGEYTAAAVACFAFGAQIPTVDTNLRRVLSRWLGTPLSGRELRDAAHRNLPVGHAETWNQAIMDLGATACRPIPDCARCPVPDHCADPSIYVRPTPQARFDGSSRQARGVVLKAVLDAGSLHIDDVADTTGLPSDRVQDAVESLAAEGLLRNDRGGLTPP